MRARLVGLGASLALACGPPPAGPAVLPGTGGGALGALPADTGAAPFTWRGYDAAVVHQSGDAVCDRVWDTVGAPSALPCIDCALVVSLHATMREDVGSGEDCPAASYTNDYAWRAASTDAALPLGLLAHQPGGWVWIGEAEMDDGLLVGRGRFTDGERVTAFTIVGAVSAP